MDEHHQIFKFKVFVAFKLDGFVPFNSFHVFLYFFFLQPVIHVLNAMLCSNEWIFIFTHNCLPTEKAEKLNAIELNYATA